MLKKVAFTMYPAKNLERAKDFYFHNFDLSPSKISVNGAWIEYDLPEGGCFRITTLAEGVEPNSNAGGSIAFEVSDLEVLVSKLKSKNVEIKLDIFNSPVCRMAIIIDSEGNAVILHEL
jgi:predicted enzyme related to lactoylglutathione lyase